jgi:hypothetical protein
MPRGCNSAMHLEAVIEQVSRCTWTLRSMEFGGILGAGRLEAVDGCGGATAAETLLIG